MIQSIHSGVQPASTAFSNRSTDARSTLTTATVAMYPLHMTSKCFERRGRVCGEGPRLTACPPPRALIRASHSMMHPALRGKSKQLGCTP